MGERPDAAVKRKARGVGMATEAERLQSIAVMAVDFCILGLRISEGTQNLPSFYNLLDAVKVEMRQRNMSEEDIGNFIEGIKLGRFISHPTKPLVCYPEGR